jgi:hypothetical protein
VRRVIKSRQFKDLPRLPDKSFGFSGHFRHGFSNRAAPRTNPCVRRSAV